MFEAIARLGRPPFQLKLIPFRDAVAACKAHCRGEMIHEKLYNLCFHLSDPLFHR